MHSWRVHLLGRDIWRPYLENILSKCPRGTSRTAKALISAMHNRHAPLTPQLAVELAQFIKNPLPGNKTTGAWAAVLERLNQALSNHGEPVPNRMGILLKANPTYSVIKLAQPIIEEACRRNGQGILFAEDNPETQIDLARYHAWCASLYKELEQMAREQKMNTFWVDRALTLATFSHRPREAVHAAMPQISAPSLSLFLGLETKGNEQRKSARHPKAMKAPQKHRETFGLKEGGLQGVRTSRRIQDMGEMLMSEFMHHPIIQADRFLNSGYLAYRREPKREKLRDALIVGIMPPSIKHGPSYWFAKACWFDFCAALGYMLVKNQMMQSEFRWLESPAYNRVRQHAFLLNDLPHSPAASTNIAHKNWRRVFMKGLGWMPSYLDQKGPESILPGRDGPSLPGEETGDSHWLNSAWKLQNDDPRWSLHHKTGSTSNRLTQNRFNTTHLMIFQPEETQAPLKLSSIQKTPGFKSTWGFSITHMPETPISPQWTLESANPRPRPLFGTAPETLTETASGLTQAWMRLITKEIGHV